MLILEGDMLILPDDSAKSRQLLDAEIHDRFRVTMLVIGDGLGFDVIASKADVRAQAMSSTRRVVWIRNPRLLTPEERSLFTRNGEAVATVLDLDGVPVVWLSADAAHDFIELEDAFLRGQSSGVE